MLRPQDVHSIRGWVRASRLTHRLLLVARLYRRVAADDGVTSVKKHLGTEYPPGMQLWVVGKQVGQELGPSTGFSGWQEAPGPLSKLTYSGFAF